MKNNNITNYCYMFINNITIQDDFLPQEVVIDSIIMINMLKLSIRCLYYVYLM